MKRLEQKLESIRSTAEIDRATQWYSVSGIWAGSSFARLTQYGLPRQSRETETDACVSKYMYWYAVLSFCTNSEGLPVAPGRSYPGPPYLSHRINRTWELGVRWDKL
jgi:hypothetical protein